MSAVYLDIRSPNINGAAPSGPINPNDDIVHFCHVAALVIIVYDHFITFDSEIEHIWSRRWSNSKILFILARYFGDLLLISVCVDLEFSFFEPKCKPPGAIGLKFVGTGSMVIIIITQMIMQLRIKALYGKVVSNFITVLWVMEVIAVLGLGIASLAAIDVHPVILATTTMCNPTYLPRFAFLFWVPVIVFESLLFSLALRIAYRNYQEIGNWRGAALLYIVLRDNFGFFICAFAAYLITATTWLTANPRYFTVPGSFSCALTSIMGCRLIINLSEAYHHPSDPEDTPPPSIWGAVTSVDIEFRSPTMTRGSNSNVKSVASASAWGGSRRRPRPQPKMKSQGVLPLPAGGAPHSQGVSLSSSDLTSGGMSSKLTEDTYEMDVHVHGVAAHGDEKMVVLEDLESVRTRSDS